MTAPDEGHVDTTPAQEEKVLEPDHKRRARTDPSEAIYRAERKALRKAREYSERNYWIHAARTGWRTFRAFASRQVGRKAEVDDDVLRRDLRAIQDRPGRASWTDACTRVGERHGLSGRRVRQRVPDTKW